jgi:hypothetical protein
MYRNTVCYGQRKRSSLPIGFHWRYAQRKNSSGHIILFNIRAIGAMTRTSGQPQVKLRLLRSNSLKIRPQSHTKSGNRRFLHGVHSIMMKKLAITVCLAVLLFWHHSLDNEEA